MSNNEIEEYHEYNLFHDDLLINNILSVYSKIIYLALFWILSFCNHSHNVVYYFDQSLCEMNNKCYQSIE